MTDWKISCLFGHQERKINIRWQYELAIRAYVSKDLLFSSNLEFPLLNNSEFKLSAGNFDLTVLQVIVQFTAVIS